MKNFKAAMLLIFSSATLCAHDFFLYPSSFRSRPGGKVKITIHVDDLFPGNAVKWNAQRVLRFEHWSGKINEDLRHLKPEKDSSAVTVTLTNPGLHMFALDWAARLIELKPEQFRQYLSSEGLDHVLALRTDRGEENKPGRERYSRYVKTLIQAEGASDDALSRVVGQTIELIPLDNPFTRRVGDSVRVRLLFRGEPLAHALVSSTYAGATDKPDTYAQSARTDANGICTVRLTHQGPWLVRTVHMLPLSGDKDADWESWWASLTFEARK